jgi:hypothetical protein
MKTTYNIYRNESCHLLNDKNKTFVFFGGGRSDFNANLLTFCSEMIG